MNRDFLNFPDKLSNIFENHKLKYWGHNCFSVESKSSLLLIDPWFSDKGAFFSSWFQYPKIIFKRKGFKFIIKKIIVIFLFLMSMKITLTKIS